MTEAEAKAKWCPFSRVPVPESAFLDRNPDAPELGVVVINRSAAGGFGKPSTCLGSDCMAWQWYTMNADEAQAAGVSDLKRHEIPSATRGYCGAFGRE